MISANHRTSYRHEICCWNIVCPTTTYGKGYSHCTSAVYRIGCSDREYHTLCSIYEAWTKCHKARSKTTRLKTYYTLTVISNSGTSSNCSGKRTCCNRRWRIQNICDPNGQIVYNSITSEDPCNRYKVSARGTNLSISGSRIHLHSAWDAAVNRVILGRKCNRNCASACYRQ